MVVDHCLLLGWVSTIGCPGFCSLIPVGFVQCVTPGHIFFCICYVSLNELYCFREKDCTIYYTVLVRMAEHYTLVRLA